MSDVRLITYNTAVGNSRIETRGTDFLKLPFYRELIEGKKNAPILAGQEIHPSQLSALKRAARNGNFQVVSIGRPAGFKGQNNVILVPKRYEVLSSESHYFKASHARGLVSTIGGWIKDRDLPSQQELTQSVDPRMWSRVQLRDKETGKKFTVFNTHLSLLPEVRLQQVKELIEEIKAAKKKGPVILAGDLNTRTAANDAGRPMDKKIRELLQKAGLTDTDATPGEVGGRSNIDWILESQFETVSSKHYTGDSLSLPGIGNARKISDHYAEEAVLRWN